MSVDLIPDPMAFEGIRGRIQKDVALGTRSWFGCGGTAECVFKPEDTDDLCAFIVQMHGLPVHVLGALSNVIIRDGGVRVPVIRLGKGFAEIVRLERDMIRVGAGAGDAAVAASAAEWGIGGFEFFSGIPGTIGGALRMNAGCHGMQTSDVLVSATVCDPSGRLHVLTPDALDLGYRQCGLPEDWIFVCATLRGVPEESSRIAQRLSALKEARAHAQPLRVKTGGSTFANPPAPTPKAWVLIDAAGGRGLRVGGAQMSEKHCNFMINTGTATATDLETLGEEIRTRVKEHSGIDLRWEIRRIGESRNAD